MPHASRLGHDLGIEARADEAPARATRAMSLDHEDGGLVAELLGSLRHFLRRAILHAERLAVLDARRLSPASTRSAH